ncbi:hypothetical protein CC80DRAFT_520271 [Byssothecium circinans]|uniref:BZIP domain-containing protein n=1 Tax=Byssothecium circinans TaxID=147558 RepID=A0A6A5TBK6_9PLEO|nr:hypothetical protein CC80DRAFT_520271 [Byssothecium circinans]
MTCMAHLSHLAPRLLRADSKTNVQNPGVVLKTTPIPAFNLAAQTLPALQTPLPHYPNPFQQSLTPPYDSSQSRYPEVDRPWSAHRGQKGSDEQKPMSQPPTSGSYPALAHNVSRRMAQMPPSQQQQQQSGGQANVPVSLPPLRHMSNTASTPLSDRRPGSLLDVHSILNPHAELAEQQQNRRRSGSQMESPSPIEMQPRQNLPSISRPTSVDSTQGESSQGRPFQAPERPRHLRSPRSPTLHRAQSLCVLARPTGTIDAHISPFLSAGSQSYFPSMPPAAPTPPPSMHVGRNELRRPSVSFPQSGSASPNPNFSPYSQPASVASSQYEGHNQQSSYMPPTNNPPMNESQQRAMAMDAERRGMPMGPSSQSSIQIMTIKSQQGHHVQIPVEVQAASKVADEKRKRNAGASARFRARRKEKEREASHSISRLETQLRDALEDIEHYRNERDYFKVIVFQQPNADRHYNRPASPRLHRPSVSVPPSNAPSSTNGGGSGGSPYSAYDDEPAELERNVRRRTSNYHPPPGQAPTPAPAFAPYDSRDQHPLPQMQQPPPPQRPVLRDPFAPADAGRYENRNWAPR